MSDDRQTLSPEAVDQFSRANESPEEIVPTQDDVIESMRQQMAEFEERDRRREEEITAANRRAENERTARERAETQAREAEARASRETDAGRYATEDAQLDAITASLTSHQSQMDSLKRAHAAAFSEGDGPKLADIQAEMALLGGKITQLDAGKAQLEARKQARGTEQPREESSSIRDPMAEREAWISQQPRLVRDWVREHPEFFSDPAFHRRAVAAATYATDVEGYSPNSQEYIDFVNEKLGFGGRQRSEDAGARQEQNQPNGRDAGESQRQAQPRSTDRRMFAAPAGGSVQGTSRSSGQETVYLTKAEKELAASQGVTEAEWAKHKRDLMNEGLIGPGARR